MENVCSHEKEIASLMEQNKTIFRYLDEHAALTRSVYELAAELKVMNTELKNIRADISELKAEMDGIRMKPAKRVDDFTRAVLSALAGAAVAFVMLRLGLS